MNDKNGELLPVTDMEKQTKVTRISITIATGDRFDYVNDKDGVTAILLLPDHIRIAEGSAMYIYPMVNIAVMKVHTEEVMVAVEKPEEVRDEVTKVEAEADKPSA